MELFINLNKMRIRINSICSGIPLAFLYDEPCYSFSFAYKLNSPLLENLKGLFI